jgi:hypothetical protein
MTMENNKRMLMVIMVKLPIYPTEMRSKTGTVRW